MRGLLLVLSLALPAFSAPELGAGEEPENFRFEITGSLWRTGIEGTTQSGLTLIDLSSDLALRDRQSFLGRFVWQARLRHKLVVEGSPLVFNGLNEVNRPINFNGRTYLIGDVIDSNTSL